MKVLIIYLSFIITFFSWSCKENSNPYGLNKEFPSMNYDSAISKIQQNDTPILIYFNSIGCVNCRKIETEIINSKKTWKNMQENYQFINLYVDDRTKLDSTKWVKAPNSRYYANKGQVNSTIQTEITQLGSQPTFCIFDTNLNLLHSFRYGERDNLHKKINQNK